jgi:hypothetical protein
MTDLIKCLQLKKPYSLPLSPFDNVEGFKGIFILFISHLKNNIMKNNQTFRTISERERTKQRFTMGGFIALGVIVILIVLMQFLTSCETKEEVQQPQATTGTVQFSIGEITSGDLSGRFDAPTVTHMFAPVPDHYISIYYNLDGVYIEDNTLSMSAFQSNEYIIKAGNYTLNITNASSTYFTEFLGVDVINYDVDLIPPIIVPVMLPATTDYCMIVVDYEDVLEVSQITDKMDFTGWQPMYQAGNIGNGEGYYYMYLDTDFAANCQVRLSLDNRFLEYDLTGLQAGKYYHVKPAAEVLSTITFEIDNVFTGVEEVLTPANTIYK